jgi:hypothetical protein
MINVCASLQPTFPEFLLIMSGRTSFVRYTTDMKLISIKALVSSKGISIAELNTMILIRD